MPTPREQSDGRAAPGAPADTRPRGWRVPLLLALLVGYPVLFYLAPIREFDGQSRFDLLSSDLLLLDEVVAGWFGDPPEFAIVDRLRVFLPAVMLLVTCAAVGWLLLQSLRINRNLTWLDQAFFACATGLSTLSLYTLAVGLAGLLHHRWLIIVPAGVAIIVAGVCSLRKPSPLAGEGRVRGSSESPAPFEGADNDGAEPARRWLWWAAPFTIAIVLGGTLTPLDFDVREYHLQAPKEFYQQGQITFLPHNVYANMPLGSEMFALSAMVALDDWYLGALVGKTMIALCGPLAALGIFCAGRRLVSPLCGAVAALVYISTPWIARVSALGMVEGVSALYLWGMVYAAILWWRGSHAERLPGALLAGFLAGSAVACKYPNLVFVLMPLVPVVGWRCWRSSSCAADQSETLVGRFAPLAGLLLAAAIACGPWFAKNWALTGNPTYPLLYSIFDGQTRTTELDAQWNRAHRPPGYSPRQVVDAAMNIAWRSSWLNPLLLPLAIIGIVGTCHRRLALALTMYSLYVLMAWWLFTHRIDRFWVPLVPVPALLAGMALSHNALAGWRLPERLFLGIGLALNLLLVVSGGGADTQYFVSIDRLRADEIRVEPWHIYLNEHDDGASKVLFVGDALAFDLNMPVLYSTVFDACLFEQLMRDRTAEERRAALAERNVRYVFVHWGEIRRYRSPGNYGFTDYIQPELFEELVRQQVLDPPLPAIDDYPGQLFPVHGASTGRAFPPLTPDHSLH